MWLFHRLKILIYCHNRFTGHQDLQRRGKIRATKKAGNFPPH